MPPKRSTSPTRCCPASPFRGRDPSGRARGLGRGPRQRPGRHLLRRPRSDGQGIRQRRPRRHDGLPHRLRHRRTGACAALGEYDAQLGTPPLHALYAGSGGAVRQKRELTGVLGIAADNRCRCWPMTSAEISAPQPGCSSSSGWCCGRARSSAVRSSSHGDAVEAFLSDYQGATSSPRSSWRSLATAASSPCAPPISARRRALRVAVAAPKGLGPDPRSYAIPAATLRAMAVYTNTMPTQAYRSSGRRPGGHLRDRTAHRHRRRAAGIDRIALAAQEPDPPRSDAVPQRRRHELRQWALRGEHGLGDGHRRLERARAAPARSGQTRQAARAYLANYVESLDRCAQRAGADRRAARRDASMS